MLRCSRRNHVYRSAHCKCSTKRREQSRLAEWLEQALHCALSKYSWTEGFVLVSGDEDDWNVFMSTRQFPLKIGPRHARHGDVEDQTCRPANAVGGEEFFR